jgi:hypothetical protein
MQPLLQQLGAWVGSSRQQLGELRREQQELQREVQQLQHSLQERGQDVDHLAGEHTQQSAVSAAACYCQDPVLLFDTYLCNGMYDVLHT